VNPRRRLPLVLAGALALVAARTGQGRAEPPLDLESAQAILAVQNLDGWLLAESGGANPIAQELVAPAGSPSRQWFYFVPAKGTPTALVHASEVSAFANVSGTTVEYTGFRDLRSALRQVLAGSSRVAMEYAPKSGIASLTLVDAGTAQLVEKLGVSVASSADLVQFTKSQWGTGGRVAHYVAMHHLARLVDQALEHLAIELAAGRSVTELDLQRFILEGYAVRGIAGPEPVVAAGVHTADPLYVPAPGSHTPIEIGQLVVLDLSAHRFGVPRPIFARLTWVAYVGEVVPARYRDLFAHVVRARDAAASLIETRIGRRRAIRGFEADQAARSSLGRAGLADKFLHRTGHSLDTSRFGDGANLDGYENHDTRPLVRGSGFTIGPALYVKGDFGMRSLVSAFIGPKGLELTGPEQQAITPVLAP